MSLKIHNKEVADFTFNLWESKIKLSEIRTLLKAIKLFNRKDKGPICCAFLKS